MRYENLYQKKEEIKAEHTAPIIVPTENLLLKISGIDFNNILDPEEISPKQIIWEVNLPYAGNTPDIREIWEITEKLPSLTQLVIEERENE